MSDKMREEFEAWVRIKHAGASLSICTHEEGYRYSIGEYKNEFVHASWIAWQASRESLVIELPSEDDTRCDTVAEIAKQEAYNLALGECTSAIEAAGLKVRP